MAEKPTSKGATIVLSIDSVPDRDADVHAWLSKIISLAKEFPGLVELQLLEPVSGVQRQWTQSLAFDSIANLSRLTDDERYRVLLADAKAATGATVGQQVIPEMRPTTVPVTVVVSQLLKPGFDEAYQKWQVKVDQAARKFPGFLGTELIRPVAGLQNEWVVVFRFDSSQHLDDWFASDAHAALMKEAEPFYENVQVRRIGRGFEDWFKNASGDTGSGTPQWKMAMVVLLTLFPTVMLLTKFVTPLMKAWPFPLAMFVSNVLSVALLTWVAMPVATRALHFWLEARTTLITLVGAGLIGALYAALVAVFTIIPV